MWYTGEISQNHLVKQPTRSSFVTSDQNIPFAWAWVNKKPSMPFISEANWILPNKNETSSILFWIYCVKELAKFYQISFKICAVSLNPAKHLGEGCVIESMWCSDGPVKKSPLILGIFTSRVQGLLRRLLADQKRQEALGTRLHFKNFLRHIFQISKNILCLEPFRMFL